MSSISPTVYIVIGGLILLCVAYALVRVLKASRLRQVFAGNPRIIDVRSEHEFATGHVGNAINIPVDRLAANAESVGSRAETIVVYCASGARSAKAARILKAAGFSKVVNAGAMFRLG